MPPRPIMPLPAVPNHPGIPGGADGIRYLQALELRLIQEARRDGDSTLWEALQKAEARALDAFRDAIATEREARALTGEEETLPE